jgi:hypothetical protein
MVEGRMLSIQRMQVRKKEWEERRVKEMMVEEEEDRGKRLGQLARVTLLRG